VVGQKSKGMGVDDKWIISSAFRVMYCEERNFTELLSLNWRKQILKVVLALNLEFGFEESAAGRGRRLRLVRKTVKGLPVATQ
jgi:hypothetical protein